jgi:hypothetical protein
MDPSKVFSAQNQDETEDSEAPRRRWASAKQHGSRKSKNYEKNCHKEN